MESAELRRPRRCSSWWRQDGATGDYPEFLSLHDYCRVFIDADAEHARVLRHRSNQPANAPALSEMLVDNNIWQ